MPKVFVTRRIPEPGLELLRRHAEVQVFPEDAPISRPALEAGLQGAGALLCMLTDKVDASLLDLAPSLKVVANYAVGTNNIDLAAAKARGIAVTNTPDVLTESTADLAWGLILDVARGISSGDRATRAGEFKGWAPLYRLGTEVSGKTLGLVGMGRIGQAVAERAKGFRMRVLYHQRKPLPSSLTQASYVDLDTLLHESDFLSLHCPLTPETHHLIGLRQFSRMKPGAFLINTARGPVVDEKALVQVLREGKLAGAGLDVFEGEPELEAGLAELGNVVLSPHLGSATKETREAMAIRAAENILSVFRNEEPRDRILA